MVGCFVVSKPGSTVIFRMVGWVVAGGPKSMTVELVKVPKVI